MGFSKPGRTESAASTSAPARFLCVWVVCVCVGAVVGIQYLPRMILINVIAIEGVRWITRPDLLCASISDRYLVLKNPVLDTYEYDVFTQPCSSKAKQ